MIDEEPLLREKFSALLRWERTKRRGRILGEVFFYAVLASLATLPAGELVSPWMSSLAWPPLLFLILTAVFFLLRPWGSQEWLRLLFLLDKTLRLEARGITAWEILNRRERKPGELLVLQESWERLKGTDLKTLFKRQRSWREISALPLLLIWLLFAWLGAGLDRGGFVNGSRRYPLARQLKEFSRDLQDRAKAQGLSESLKVALALEEASERSLRGELSEKKLSEDLAGMVSKVGDISPGTEETNLQFSGTNREGLLDLKTELEAFKPTFSLRADRREERLAAEILRKMGTLPHLSEEIGKHLPSLQEMGELEFNSLLEKLEKSVTAELDRRMLREIGESLNLLLRGGEGREQGEALRLAGRAAQGELPEAEKIRGKGNSPGSQPGTKDQALQPAPPVTAGAASQLKGFLREGKSGSIPLRGEFSGKGSIVPRQELLTSYRRQMEEELASEQIPEGLKETVKRYFLSLGFSESKKGE